MMSKAVLASVALASALLVFPSLASALTAEETFLYIAFDMQDGDVKPYEGWQTTVTNLAAEPFTVEVAQSNGETARYIIEQSPACVFNVKMDLGAEGTIAVRFDMTKFVGINPFPLERPKGNLEFANECAIQVVENGRCLAKDFRPDRTSTGNMDTIRRLKAVKFFKTEFCAGLPF